MSIIEKCKKAGLKVDEEVLEEAYKLYVWSGKNRIFSFFRVFCPARGCKNTKMKAEILLEEKLRQLIDKDLIKLNINF